MYRKKNGNDDKLKIIEHLYSNFEHRMDFFWKSYYRLLLYHLAIPIVPFLALKYIENIKIDNNIYLGYLPTIALIITLIGIITLPSTVKYLIGEDNRVIVVHNVYKSKLKDFKINLNLENDKNIKTGTIMIKKFYRLILIFSFLIMYGIFALFYYSKTDHKDFFGNTNFLLVAFSVLLLVYIVMTFYMKYFIVKKNSLRY